MKDLSIIIVSFNTKDITKKSLSLLKKNFSYYPLDYEVIVVDNDSKDGSGKMLKELEKKWPQLKVILAKDNLGFGKANNLGLKHTQGRYILYLNSDVFVYDLDFRDLIYLLDNDRQIGAMTIKLKLPVGGIDPACHRGLPTIWRSLVYFLGLEKIFFNFPLLNRFFGGYHLVWKNLDEVHEVEVVSGAFLLTRKEILDKIGGFDEDYFAYGEDVEMCYQIKKLGYKIIYYPLWSAVHLKSVSGLKKKDVKVRKKTSFYFYDSMKIFYRKHFEKNHPWFLNQLVYRSIDLLRLIR